jgi:hypothetical protein
MSNVEVAEKRLIFIIKLEIKDSVYQPCECKSRSNHESDSSGPNSAQETITGSQINS